MIREINKEDFSSVNELLKEFNYEINEKSFENKFYNVWVYIENYIKGVLVFQKIYDRVEIDYIAVDKNSRKLGIGTEFIDKLVNLDIKNITLEVRESNEAAIEFYKKNKFEIVAIRKNYYGIENGFLMIRKIGE